MPEELKQLRGELEENRRELADTRRELGEVKALLRQLLSRRRPRRPDPSPRASAELRDRVRSKMVGSR